jgi:hypothetical protein
MKTTTPGVFSAGFFADSWGAATAARTNIAKIILDVWLNISLNPTTLEELAERWL